MQEEERETRGYYRECRVRKKKMVKRKENSYLAMQCCSTHPQSTGLKKRLWNDHVDNGVSDSTSETTGERELAVRASELCHHLIKSN